MGDIAVDRAVRKALSSESRVHILKLISSRRRTQSELAKELSLSSPTILEHLSILIDAGLVEKIDEGRKWKYYQLTEKGRMLMGVKYNPVPIRSIVMFAISLVLIVSSLYMLGVSPPQEVVGVYSESKVQEVTSGDVQPQMRLLAVPPNKSASLYSEDGEESLVNDLQDKGKYYVMFVLGVIILALAIYTYLKSRQR